MMKKNEIKKVEVHKNVYATPFYEMEVWGVYNDQDEEDLEPESDSEEDKSMLCDISSLGVGYYPTKESALDAYREMLAEPSENCTILAMHIREKVMSSMLGKGSYMKEWCYDNKSSLLDESILKNFDDDDYGFYGRPANMIRHNAGEIVQVLDENDKWCWAIILGPVPTVEQINERNKKIAEDVSFEVEEGHTFFWWAYDSYLILTGEKGKEWDSGLPQRVFKPMMPVPDFVKQTLTEAYNRESKTDFTYF